MRLAQNITGVAAVTVAGPNLPVGAMDDQLAAITSGLRARYGDGLRLRGHDDGGALRAGRDDGEAVGAGGDVDVFAHDSCRFFKVCYPCQKGTPSQTTEREVRNYVNSKYFRGRNCPRRGHGGG